MLAAPITSQTTRDTTRGRLRAYFARRSSAGRQLLQLNIVYVVSRVCILIGERASGRADERRQGDHPRCVCAATETHRPHIATWSLVQYEPKTSFVIIKLTLRPTYYCPIIILHAVLMGFVISYIDRWLLNAKYSHLSSSGRQLIELLEA